MMIAYMHFDAMIGKHKPYRLEGMSCGHMCCISANSNLALLQLCLKHSPSQAQPMMG